MCPTFCVSSVDHFESANASPFSWFDQILRIGGSLAKFTSNDLFLANISICTVISVQRCITSSIVKKYHCHKTLCPGTSLPKDPPQCLPVCRQVTCASAAGLCKDTPWVFLHCQTEYFFIAKQSISQTPGLLICTIVHNKPLQWLARLCEDIPLASHCVVLYVYMYVCIIENEKNCFVKMETDSSPYLLSLGSFSLLTINHDLDINPTHTPFFLTLFHTISATAVMVSVS